MMYKYIQHMVNCPDHPPSFVGKPFSSNMLPVHLHGREWQHQRLLPEVCCGPDRGHSLSRPGCGCGHLVNASWNCEVPLKFFGSSKPTRKGQQQESIILDVFSLRNASQTKRVFVQWHISLRSEHAWRFSKTPYIPTFFASGCDTHSHTKHGGKLPTIPRFDFSAPV
jgi:hypothetical protein